jgi:uncharacterized protein (TIGR02452 family)
VVAGRGGLGRGTSADWDAQGWLERYRCTGQQCHDNQDQRELLKEVADHNKLLIDQRKVYIPETVYSAFKPEFMDQQLIKQQLVKKKERAVITFSTMFTTQAAIFFSQKAKAMSILNFANGEKMGGGYSRGSRAQEEDLCRAFPGLYGSLGRARDKGCYPFGPVAYARHNQRYADVLFTDDCDCMRRDHADGWDLLGSRDRFKASIVSAAAPNLSKAEPMLPEELLNLHAHILLAPKMFQSKTDILILGAFGCGVFQNDPMNIAKHFAHLLSSQFYYARLYDEIHFAIPPGTNYNSFVQVFKEAQLNPQVYQ